MKKIAIVYGTSTGVTEEIAQRLLAHFDGADIYNADKVNAQDLTAYDVLILGSSTQGVGDVQDDWEILLPKMAKLDLKGKKIALFALGDSASFSTSFAGAMAHIYKALKGKADFIGAVSTDGYTYDDSDAVENDMFIGLPIDEDNESDLTDERLATWAEALKAAM